MGEDVRTQGRHVASLARVLSDVEETGGLTRVTLDGGLRAREHGVVTQGIHHLTA